MSVPLIEDSSGHADSDSGGTTISSSTTTTTSDAAGGRELVTIHAGSGYSLSRDDLELLLVLAQTLAVLAWVYAEVIDS